MNIALFVNYTHLIIAGGVGQSVLNFVRDFHKTHGVVIITDRKPRDNPLITELEALTQIFFPDKELTYDRPAQMFGLLEKYHPNRHANYMNALERAEMWLGNIGVRIIHHIDAWDPSFDGEQIVYTHNEYTIGPRQTQTTFDDAYLDFHTEVYQHPNSIVVTQSDYNVELLGLNKPVSVAFPGLTIPIPTYQPDMKSKTRYTYLGRGDPRKQPDLWIKSVPNFPDLTPTVITKYMKRHDHGKKFEHIDGVDIHRNLTATPKNQILSQTRWSFHPSNSESFGMAALECALHHPTFVLEEPGWWKHTNNILIPLHKKGFSSAQKEVVDGIDIDLYTNIVIRARDWASDAQKRYFATWRELLG